MNTHGCRGQDFNYVVIVGQSYIELQEDVWKNSFLLKLQNWSYNNEVMNLNGAECSESVMTTTVWIRRGMINSAYSSSAHGFKERYGNTDLKDYTDNLERQGVAATSTCHWAWINFDQFNSTLYICMYMQSRHISLLGLRSDKPAHQHFLYRHQNGTWAISFPVRWTVS